MGSNLRKAAAVVGVARRSDPGEFDVSHLSPRAFLRHPLSHLPAPLPRRSTRVPALAAPLPVGRG